ncbi:MAG: tetratricopeptide repeat protein [Microcystis sp. LE19-84.1B]|jgi:tetratricopeptide (TPR) repeat protein|uniref:tetratricopeptide repeat protein n=1 Tax=Microcystis sp. LE19-84.1B TaxID=3016438 RepID=UPI0022BEADDA|nr:tetratricopeptide repeat protein [Microcystis sp. LE19-84.1B]MCZ8224314.1 tetratricopeptide repeat protein [Microcystis sp. LE19-84.1B]
MTLKEKTDGNFARGLESNSAESYLKQGIERSRQGSHQRAIANFNRAISLDPNLATAYYQRGISYSELGDTQKAVSDWQKAAELDRQQGKMEEYQEVLRRISRYSSSVESDRQEMPNPVDSNATAIKDTDIPEQEGFKEVEEGAKPTNETTPKPSICPSLTQVGHRLNSSKVEVGESEKAQEVPLADSPLLEETSAPQANRQSHLLPSLRIALSSRFSGAATALKQWKVKSKTPWVVGGAILLLGLGGIGFWQFQVLSDNRVWEESQQVNTIKGFEKYLQKYPKGQYVTQANEKLADLYNHQGLLHFEQDKKDLALADYNKAIELNPQNAEVYRNRGKLYFYSSPQKKDLALADYKKAIELDPYNTDVYGDRALLYVAEKKVDLAWADYNKAIELNPKNAKAYIDRGTFYTLLQKNDLALIDFSQAIAVDPKNANAYHFRGFVYHLQQKNNLALGDYNKAIELDPKYANAYTNRGQLYLSQNKTDLALADYNKAIEVDPKYADAYYKRGHFYWGRGMYVLALADYNKKIELAPDADTYAERGFIYWKQKMYDLALADANKAIALDPQEAFAYVVRGTILVQRGNRSEARADLQKAAALFKQQGNQKDYQFILNLLQQL